MEGWTVYTYSCNSQFVTHIVNQQYTFSINTTLHYLANWYLYREFARAWRTGVFRLHALLFSLGAIVVYPGFVACYYMSHKQIPVQSFRFSLGSSHQQAFIFWSSIWGPIVHIFFVTASDHLNSTSVCAYTVGYQQHIDSTILQYRIFKRLTLL